MPPTPFSDIDPQDIDPDTGRPYANYSSPALEDPYDCLDEDDTCQECAGEGGYNSCMEDSCAAIGGEEGCDDPLCWRICSACKGRG